MTSYFYEIAVPVPLEGPFTYKSDQKALQVGCRVAVPFGPRLLIGVVLAEVAEPDNITYSIRGIKRVVDENPVFSPTLMAVALFLHQYYFHPHGETFKVMLPAGIAKKAQRYAHLTAKGLEAVAAGGLLGLVVKDAFKGRKVLKLMTLKKKGLSLDPLLEEGLLTIESSIRPRESITSSGGSRVTVTKEQTLTDNQKSVYDAITAGMGPNRVNSYAKPFLLHGITGSGKTEVYLHLINFAFENQKYIYSTIEQDKWCL